jgi:hypothetical protein
VKFVIRHPANGNDFFVDIDSLVVKDSTAVSSVLSASKSSTNATCHGKCDGVASVTPSGGTPQYTITWSNGLGTGTSKTNLCAGTYTVTVTDAAPSTIVDTIIISQPSPLQVSATSQNVACHGDSSGCINLSVTGGTSSYHFLWSNNSTQQNNCGLKASTYAVTVTDNQNCTVTSSAAISEPSSSLSFTANATDHYLPCFKQWKHTDTPIRTIRQLFFIH